MISIDPFQPVKSHRKLSVILWLKTRQKAGKRANRGKELDKSWSISGIHIMPILS